MLMNFMEKYSLMSVQCLNDELNRCTYIPKRTTIDHILIESNNKACVLDFSVMKEDDILTSDHVPILAKLKSSRALPATQRRVPSTAWNKCIDNDMTKYQDHLWQCLTCLQEENIQDDPNLLNTYVVDYRLFWKLLNKKKCRRTDTCNELKVESTTYTGDEIVDGFKNYYKQVFDCDNITTRRDADTENYVRLNTVVECKQNKGLIDDVTVSEIRKATSTLKKQKAPGIDDICSEHIYITRRRDSHSRYI